MAKGIIWEIKIRIADAELPAGDPIQQPEPTQIDFVEIDEVLVAVKVISAERQPEEQLSSFWKGRRTGLLFQMK
jgi:hypothetical protein